MSRQPWGIPHDTDDVPEWADTDAEAKAYLADRARARDEADEARADALADALDEARWDR